MGYKNTFNAFVHKISKISINNFSGRSDLQCKHTHFELIMLHIYLYNSPYNEIELSWFEVNIITFSMAFLLLFSVIVKLCLKIGLCLYVV